MCALEYFTTPSSSSSRGLSPNTGMIEWAVTGGSTRIEARVRMKGLEGFMLSTLLGRSRNSAALSGSSAAIACAISSPVDRRVPGSFTMSASQREIRASETELPRWGVEMKITRCTKGKGVTNMEWRMRSLVSGLSFSSSSGFLLMLSQNFVPLLIAVSLVRRPPWLCPITTIRRSAGSFPSGSKFPTARARDFRKIPAERRMGFPVLYVKSQNW